MRGGCHRLALFQDEELKYALKRLVEGLGATREAARPGFSLALAQVSALESQQDTFISCLRRCKDVFLWYHTRCV